VSSHRQRGFTLIETVIAFAILGLSLSALYGAFGSALSRTRRDAKLSEATLIAQSLLARAGTELPASGGTYTGEWNDYKYELTQQASAPPGPGMATVQTVRVTARVSWPGSSGPREIEVSTLALQPATVQP
jgi:general secretion pathway protein I